MASFIACGAWAAFLAVVLCGQAAAEPAPQRTELALFGWGEKKEPATPPPPRKQDLFCPRVSIQPGTAAFILYERGQEGSPLGVRYQASFTEFVRECVDLGAEAGIRVGVAGRALAGPRGTSGQFEVPIRFVVMDGDQKVVISRVTKLKVSIPAGQSGVTFTHVEEMGSAPMSEDRLKGWEIRVGFETKAPVGPRS